VLRARLARRETLVDLVRQAHMSQDPRQVASWLIRQAADWIPAPLWGVAARDVDGQFRLLATHGVTPALEPALWAGATMVLQRHRALACADLALEPEAPPDARGALVGWPLHAREELVGALVGLDPVASAVTPALGAAVEPLLHVVFDVAAVALDNALRMERAEALSVTDDLTRLYNVRYLNHALRREAKLAGRNNRPVSLAFLDLDGFKTVNDRFGHLAGSKALIEVGALLKSCARETDIVARFGGDEFAVVLPDTGGAGAVTLAERVRSVLNAHSFLTGDGLSVKLTASIGIATLPDVAASAEELLKVADAAMYRVKAAGKDGIRVGLE